MRLAKCVRPLRLTLLGNQGSVAIAEGWEGDLDQVIGLTDRGPMTVMDALGHHFTPANFEVAAAPTRMKRAAVAASPAATPQS